MKFATHVACLGALFCSTAFAGPADYVYTPHVAQGEREIDFKFGSAAPLGGRNEAASVGFGYGATARWFTEAYLKYESAAGGGPGFAQPRRKD